MNRILKILFFALIVKPLILVFLGVNHRNHRNQPTCGPAIIAANHNSHLDTLVLMGLYPLYQVHRVRPVAAADYFFCNRALKWFSLNIIGIIPLERKSRKCKEELFAGCKEALENKEILLLYPEGSRGEPGHMATLKKGIYHIASLKKDTPITPVFMTGLDKALPKGEALFVPFNCEVIIGESKVYDHDITTFIEQLQADFDELHSHSINYS